MEKKETMHELLDSELLQASGWTSVSLSIYFTLINLISELPVNEILQFCVTLGGFVFLIYKIQIARLTKRKLKDEEITRRKKGKK